MPKGAPFHVLMLPTGSDARGDSSKSDHTAGVATLARSKGAKDDYLDRRFEHRRSSATESEHEKWKDVAVKDSTMGDDSVVRKNASAEPLKPGNENDENDTSGEAFWSGASPLEKALVDCCEGHDDSHANSESGRTRGSLLRGSEGRFVALLKRFCHDVSDRSLALAILQRTIQRDEQRATKLVSSRKRKRNEKCCDIAAGEKGEHGCNSQSTAPKTSGGENGARLEEKGLLPHSEPKSSGIAAGGGPETGSDSCRDDGSSRMANFLSAGGMKILTEWLVEAFTPVPAAASRSGRNPSSDNKASQELARDPATSKTGSILLALLGVLKAMPFDMNLIKETQINKQIKKLKKSLDKVIAIFEEKYTDGAGGKKVDSTVGLGGSMDDFRHPVAGGMVVVQVRGAVESLMDTWKKAAASKNPDEKTVVGDYFANLHSTMKARYEALAKYDAGGGPKPPWLEKADDIKDAAATSGKTSGSSAKGMASRINAGKKSQAARVEIRAHAKRQNETESRNLDANKKIRDLEAERRNAQRAAQAAREAAKEKMEAFRRKKEDFIAKKREAEMLEQQRTKRPRVSWADQVSKKGGEEQRPLVEVRTFVKEVDIWESKHEKKNGHDGGDERKVKDEDDDFGESGSDKIDGVPIHSPRYTDRDDAAVCEETQQDYQRELDDGYDMDAEVGMEEEETQSDFQRSNEKDDFLKDYNEDSNDGWEDNYL